MKAAVSSGTATPFARICFSPIRTVMTVSPAAMVAVAVSPSQPTAAPNASATKRMGSIMRPPRESGAVSSVTAASFRVAARLPSVSVTLVSAAAAGVSSAPDGTGCGVEDGPAVTSTSGPPSGFGTNFNRSMQVMRGDTVPIALC